MKKRRIAFLCLFLTLLWGTGCRNNVPEENSGEQTTPETTVEAAEIAEESPAETPPGDDGEELVSPVVFDKTVPVEKGMHIAVIVKETDSGYWKNMEKHMKEAVKYLNQFYDLSGEDEITMTFEGPGTDADVNTQINTIDAVLSENPTVLCLAAIDVESCEAQLETARENGIPVIMFDSDVRSELARVYCGTDNVRAGRLAADKLSKAIGDSGEVAVVAHESFTQTSKARVKGFRRRIKKHHPDVALNKVIYDNGEEPLEDMLRSMLDANEDLKGIFCTSDTMAEAVLDVLKDYSDRDIRLVGFDSGSVQRKAIEEGLEYGTVVQDTWTMAYETIRAAVCAASSEEETEAGRKEVIYVPYIWIDQTGVEAEENTKYLYD